MCFFDFQPGIKPRVDGKKGIPASAHRKLGSDLSALKAGLSVRIVNDVSLIFTIELLEDMTDLKKKTRLKTLQSKLPDKTTKKIKAKFIKKLRNLKNT